jgi:hypothetical protein
LKINFKEPKDRGGLLKHGLKESQGKTFCYLNIDLKPFFMGYHLTLCSCCKVNGFWNFYFKLTLMEHQLNIDLTLCATQDSIGILY